MAVVVFVVLGAAQVGAVVPTQVPGRRQAMDPSKVVLSGFGRLGGEGLLKYVRT